MSKPATVLYVEDEENDALLMQFAFREAGLRHTLKIVGNGQQAIEYLSGNSGFADREAFPLPDLVLLDLNLPRVPGMKVLEWIRQQPQFRTLPVVVYTSSGQPRDWETARRLRASDFIVKASDYGEIIQVAKAIASRWL